MSRTRRAEIASSVRPDSGNVWTLRASCRERSIARAKRFEVLSSNSAAALVRIAGPLT